MLKDHANEIVIIGLIVFCLIAILFAVITLKEDEKHIKRIKRIEEEVW